MKRSFHSEELLPNKKVDEKSGTSREVTTVLVSNLPKSYNLVKVQKLFSECGMINHVDVVDSLDKTYRMARIEFHRYDEALTALTKTLKKIGQNEITVTLLENCTIWITNFPPGYTQRDIKELFHDGGAVALSVRFPSLRFNSNRRFAYVDVCSTEEAEGVVSRLNGKEVNGLCLVVKKSNPMEKSKRSDHGAAERREIMIRKLDTAQMTEQFLRHHFQNFGEVESITIPAKQLPGSGTGYAFLTFAEQSAAKRALEVDVLDGKEVSVSLADRKAYIERQKVKSIMQGRFKDDRIISIFPLRDKTSKDQIERLLHDRAKMREDAIEDIFLVADKEGALVLFRDAKEAARCAMSVEGTEFHKTRLHCGTVYDLRKRRLGERVKPVVSASTGCPRDKPGSDTGIAGPKLSNEDFRNMFLKK